MIDVLAIKVDPNAAELYFFSAEAVCGAAEHT
jgi:hypothetical protein